MAIKIPLYTPIHKGQRKCLADMVVSAGRADFANKVQIEPLTRDLHAFTEHLAEHADLEERFVHPLLDRVAPGCSRSIAAEHVSQHKELVDLSHSLELIASMPADHETLPQTGHEYYLALSRFVSTYLRHIDFEEDHAQQILLNACTADELFKTFQSILAAQSPAALRTNLKLMVDGSSLPEVIGIFSGAQSFMPAPQFEQMIEYAATFVEPERWSAIEARLKHG